MKKGMLLGGLLLCLLLAACGGGQTEGKSYTQITPQQAKTMMDEQPQAVILDVREQEEYDAGHIPHAVLLPIGTICEITAQDAIPTKETTVLVYCRSGNRSKTAAQALADLGYTQVYEFGGIRDWPYAVVS